MCDAPDVIYLEDTDGDGRADVRKTLLTGFATHNAQARVNSLRWGLDNWLYGSCGLFGGDIRSFSGREIELGSRDFRFKPATGEIEAVTGKTQQGRARNDWDNWFGCENGTLCEALSDRATIICRAIRTSRRRRAKSSCRPATIQIDCFRSASR